MWQNSAAFLRQAFNSRPLKKDLVNWLYLRNAEIDDLDSYRLKAWDSYQLYVEDSTESLLKLLHESLSDRDFQNPIYLEQYQNKITLAACKIENLSAIAYLTGLSILQQLNVKPTELELTFENLQYLEPREITSQTEIDLLINEKIKIEIELLSARGNLAMQAQTLLDRKFQEYADLNKLLEIHPTDTQAEVVGKAVSLRQFGRIEEAIEAYSKYGRMFPDAEPPTRQYVATAQAFTRQIAELDVIGGIYIYQVFAGQLVQQAGIIVGDIITHCDRKPITNPNEMAAALTAIADDAKPILTYIRLQPEGYFTRATIAIEGKPLGIQFVGI
jgi:tetratricopeptide (TPR) repeat protein